MIYFFAGEVRKGDIGHWLKVLCSELTWELHLVEIDILRGGMEHDLLDPCRREQWLNQALEQHAVLCTPPCSTFSRVTWSNNRGPHPIRSAKYPSGFPWLSAADRAKAETGNILVQLLWDLCNRVRRQETAGKTIIFAEHPEDLGKIENSDFLDRPASIWQADEFHGLIQAGWWSGAFRQCDFAALTPKPTRALSNSWEFLKLAKHNLPMFDEEFAYLGPVTRCEHDHKTTLTRKRGESGPFRTAAAAAYPSEMCKVIAECILNAVRSEHSLREGGTLECSNLPPPPQLTSDCTNLPPRPLEESRDKDPCSSFEPKWTLKEGIDFVKAGWYGKGEAIRTFKGPGRLGRPFIDGGGLCSPGRWVWEERILPSKGSYIQKVLDSWLDDKTEAFAQDVIFKAFLGKLTTDPLAGLLESVALQIRQLLSDEGFEKHMVPQRDPEAIDFALMGVLGTYLGDPDAASMDEFCTGARVGVDTELHRTWTVWPPKKKWPLPDYDPVVAIPLNSNYPSAAKYRDPLLAEIADQIKRGWMIPMTLGEARKKFGEVHVAAMAVIEEKPGKFRCLHDASNSVQINHRIKVVDGEQCPSALDIQAAVTWDKKLQKPILGLVIDVEKAHRRVPIDPRDWGYLACSTEPRPTEEAKLEEWEILVNTVGTYGVASASWLWARVASLFQRICYYTCGLPYIFRFADDFLCVTATIDGTRYTRPLMRFLMMCNLLKIPIKWSKTRGGLQCEYVGYFFDWVLLKGGLSERRARWLVDWSIKTVKDRIIAVRECRAALGRFAFSAILLRHLLPYLGPFYAWVAALGDGAVLPLPAALMILLKWMGEQVQQKSLVNLRLTKPRRMQKSFLADAKADGEEVCIGGYMVDSNDPSNTKEAKWYSIQLNRQNCPWAFVKQGQAFRCIAALELLATLMSLILLCPVNEETTEAEMAMEAFTDNLGNEGLVVKNLTSKFPLYLILLELTEQLKYRKVQLELTWIPRERNQAADDLSNGKFDLFSPQNRVLADLSTVQWLVLPELLAQAEDLGKEIQEKKQIKKRAQPVQDLVKRRKTEALRVSDPW